MASTEPRAGGSLGGNVEGSITASSEPIDRECQKCRSYLTRALERVGSQPQSLLRALGVASHRNGNSERTTSNRLYEPTANGQGVMISLRNSEGVVGGDLMSPDHMHGDQIPSSASVDAQNANEEDPVTLGRRFTDAATLLADGIRHSAEDLLSDRAVPKGGILSTSPAAEPDQPLESSRKGITTIAIECQKCGSETRAEAGARAYVRGPEPLSIVLCSNRLSSQREVDEALTHELVHIFDVHSRGMNLRDCRQLAYSEVRAAREAECSNR
ncbi:hypothetical protein ACHAWF_002151 [Thalassiosira exigua]